MLNKRCCAVQGPAALLADAPSRSGEGAAGGGLGSVGMNQPLRGGCGERKRGRINGPPLLFSQDPQTGRGILPVAPGQ